MRVDPSLNLTWNAASPPVGLSPNQYLVRWTGYITLPSSPTTPTGNYQLGVIADDGAKITVNNTVEYSDWNTTTGHAAPSSPSWSTAFPLTQNTPVPIEIDYFNIGGNAQMSLFVQGASLTSELVPSTWLAPGESSLPTGWTLSLPGAANSYTRAEIGATGVVLTDSSGTSHSYLGTGPYSTLRSMRTGCWSRTATGH